MRIDWSPEAVEDLAALRAFIAQDDTAAAQRTVQRVVDAVERLLGKHPAIGRAGRVPGTRELPVAGTPFIVPYRIQDNVLQVLRVYHGARRWPRSF